MPILDKKIINKEMIKLLPPEESLMLFDTYGFSMWPFLCPGEKVIVRKIKKTQFKLGDIILYKKNDQFVCHRLVKIEEAPVERYCQLAKSTVKLMNNTQAPHHTHPRGFKGRL